MAIPVGFGSSGGRGISPLPSADWSSAYGGRPSVPSPGASAGTAIGSNIGNLSDILNLGGGVNRFTDAAAINQVRQGLPNYDALVAESSANILKEIQGDLPGDVINQILQKAAERGIITGTVGSESANAAMLRALGLTSLDLMQRGEQNLTAAIGRTPRGPIFDPSKMFISPNDQQEAEIAARIYDSMPNPEAAARAAMSAARSGISSGMGAVGAPSWASGQRGNSLGAASSWDQFSDARNSSGVPTVVYGSPGGGTDPSFRTDNPGSSPNAWQNYLNSTFGVGSPWANPIQGQDVFPDISGTGYFDLEGDYFG